ncbi:ASCH domain-containing protein [Lederbergia lenta]|uniref:ASCH domain n=1 Tax=Lederbergia lenta TaxID=1467 RepID=A0A2X4VUN8_LEDLE|nr:ASCH domain-containing protein [Lederbergia lenta]MCM3112687.1 ASCH domain-containing protein [Lederbergia lenta]MEC2323726.1 ASCH domain-containing protein [Lederbergia lenta]SQI51558.1 ASCH domain [Lederbergia lenta]
MTLQNKNDALPPKTCTIERLVTVPADIEKVIKGEKTATRRNGRYADIGEVMILQDREFVVERVYSQALGEMTDEHAQQEGFATLDEYKESILSMHPGMPWVPKMKVWVHEFVSK